MKRPIIWVAGILFAFFLIVRFYSGGKMDENYYTMDKIVMENTQAEVCGTFYQREQKTKSDYLLLKNVSVTFPNTRKIFHFSNFLAIVPKSQEMLYQPGNLLQISGSVKSFSPPSNPGQFDEKSYYKEKNIYYKIYGTSCRIKNPGNDKFLTKLYQFKDTLKQVYECCLPQKEAGIITAMLLGDKSTLDIDIKNLYQINGIGHLLAISGLHISVLCLALYKMLRFLLCGKIYWIVEECRQNNVDVFQKKCISFFLVLLRKLPFLVTVFFLLAYGKMTGFGISTSRAVIMMILYLMAGECGRSYDAFTAMGVSAVIIWLQNPYAIFSSSFLLSYSAMAGVSLVLPSMELYCHGTDRERQKHLREKKRKMRKITGIFSYVFAAVEYMKDKLLSSVLCSISIWLATLPVLCYFFYEYPTYAVLLNIFVLPLASVLVIAGMLGGVAGALWLPAGKCILAVVRLILYFYEAVCRIFQKLPHAVQITGRPDKITIFVYYLLLIFFCLVLLRGIRRREHFIQYVRAAMAGSLFPGIVALTSGSDVRGFCCTVLDVGQGDGIVLRTETGQTVLIDGGSTSVSQVGKYRIIPFLKYYGICRIDAMIMTHEDEDHISGQRELLETVAAEGISINRYFLPEPDDTSRGDNYMEMERAAFRAGIPCQKLHAGDKMIFGKLQITCIHPEKGFVADSANAYSTTLDVHYGERSLLLTGDLEKNGEEQITKSLENYEILKTAHHGSKNSSKEEYLAKVRPEAAVISCGKNNRYGHPHKELLERLALYTDKIYRTDEQGAVFLQTDGERWQIRGYCQDE